MILVLRKIIEWIVAPLRRIEAAFYAMAAMCALAGLALIFAQQGNQSIPGASSGTITNGAGSNPLGASFNVKASGAIGDAKKTITAVTSNGSGTIQDTTNSPWLITDVGKKIYCVFTVGGNNVVALNLTIATITSFTSSSQIGVNTTGNGNTGAGTLCVWFTQKETASLLAAGTAAQASLKSIIPFLSPALAYPTSIYIPCGGYVVDSTWFIQNSAAGNSLGVGIIGGGKGCTWIYVSPDVSVSNSAWMINSTQNRNFTFSDFSIDCSLESLSVAAPGIRMNTSAHFVMRDLEIDGCGTTGDNNGLIQLVSSTNVIWDDITLNNAPLNDTEPPFVISGGNLIHIRNLDTTNPSPVAAQIATSGAAGTFAGGPRSVTNGGIIIEDSIFDEGATPGCLSITSSSVNMIGVSCMEGSTTGISVDANSSVYMSEVVVAPFNGGCSGGNRNAVTIATTGYVYATGSDFEGCGTSSAISGTSAGTFVSAGGNTWRTCTGTTPCPLVSIANYGTLAFSGGIIPKSSETHSPNTCQLTISPIVNATTYTLCSINLDQNYQILTLSASSVATTTCATAPIITVSDGTRSVTLTLTSGTNSWGSTGLSTVFASASTLTVKYDVAGASACVTPPTNLAISYALQSVLNP